MSAPQQPPHPAPSYAGYPPPAGPPTWSAPPPAPAPRRRRLPVVLALIAGAAVVAGVSAWTAVLVDGHAARTTTAAGPVPIDHHAAAKATGVAGTVTAENGSTWTVTSGRGRTYTVSIGAGTKFGTADKPVASSTIVTGSKVRVVGRTSGDSVTATRVAPAAGAAATGTAATS